jgi:hypothetical protein
MVRIAIAVASLLGACMPRELDWQIDFSDDSLEQRVVRVEATVLRNGCDGTDVVFERTASLGDGVELPELEPGIYGFRVRVSDSECFVFGAGCARGELPTDQVRVELLPIVPIPTCDGSIGEACRDGACVVSRPGPTDGCDPGHAECNGECVRLDSAEHCGRCEPTCGAGDEGVASTSCERQPNGTHECVLLCNAPAPLSFACTDTNTDVLNCGRAGNACPERRFTRALCAGGQCQYQCIEGAVDDDGDPSNGCPGEEGGP